MANQEVRIGIIGIVNHSDLLSTQLEEEFKTLKLSIEFLNSEVNTAKICSEPGHDVVILDADLPAVDIQKIKEVKKDLLPVIILVSSSKSKAIEAFEINALDFLLKPLKKERIVKCLKILKKKLLRIKVFHGLDQIEKIKLPSGSLNGNGYINRILVREGNKMVFVDVNSILWIESESNYNRLYTEKDSHLNRGSLKNIIQKLNPKKFFRIHRSVIVNIEMVKEIEPFFHGDYKVIMKDNTELKISRNYTDFLSDFKCTA